MPFSFTIGNNDVIKGCVFAQLLVERVAHATVLIQLLLHRWELGLLNMCIGERRYYASQPLFYLYGGGAYAEYRK